MHAFAKRPKLPRSLPTGKRLHEALPVQTPGKVLSLGIIHYDLGHEYDQELGELESGHYHEESSA